MKKPIVFMFSGQGSQYYQMGKELYENHPRFKLWMDHCNSIVHPLINASLIDILYRHHNKSDPFDRVLYTNPAIICIEYSLARMLMEQGIRPDYLLGYSLGEMTAAIVSGAMSLEDGIHLVVHCAQILEDETPAAGMLAIIDSKAIIQKFSDAFKNCWVTATNFNKNFVVGGLYNDIEKLHAFLKSKNIISQRLAVNYGFHTSLINPLENAIVKIGRRINFSVPNIPVISSLETDQIMDINETHLWRVTRLPVEFEKTIFTLIQKKDYIFIDVGPSGTLATFVKYILPPNSTSVYLEIMNQFGKDLSVLEKLKINLQQTGMDALVY
jgi:acyl transferase domain-containing protein